jgi:hypothetical protein
LLRGQDLLRGVARSPDPGVRAEELPRLSRAHPVEAQVDAIHLLLPGPRCPGTECERYVAASVHDDSNVRLLARFSPDQSPAVRGVSDTPRELEEGLPGEVLLADLHPIHALSDRFANHFRKGTAGQEPIRHETKDGSRGRRQG